MRWNTLALECQLFLDVDCSSFTYSSTVHPQLVTAATQLWNKQYGWADEEDKKRKILALPRYIFSVTRRSRSDSRYSVSQSVSVSIDLSDVTLVSDDTY